MNTRKLLGAIATCSLTLLAASSTAHAAVGYVCEAYFDRDTGYGNFGYVYASFYTQPSCAGTWLEGAIFCTSGASASTYCNTNHLYNDLELQTLMQNLQRAAAAKQPVTPVFNGAQGYFVIFRSS